MPAAIYAATSPDELSAVGIDPSSVVGQRSAVGLPPQPPAQTNGFYSGILNALTRDDSASNPYAMAGQGGTGGNVPPPQSSAMARLQAANAAQEAAQSQAPQVQPPSTPVPQNDPNAGPMPAPTPAPMPAPQSYPEKPATPLSGTDAPTAPNATDPNAPNLGQPAWLTDPNARSQFLDGVVGPESGGRNIRQLVGNETAGNGTGPASGYYQIENNTWDDFAPKAGVSLKQYPTAMDAPQDIQKRVADQVLQAQGPSAWSTYTAGKVAGFTPPPSGANGPMTGVNARLANAMNAQNTNNAQGGVNFQQMLSGQNIAATANDIQQAKLSQGYQDPRSMMAPVNPMYRPGDAQSAINTANMGAFLHPRAPGLLSDAVNGANAQQINALNASNANISSNVQTGADLRMKMAQGAMQQQQLNALMGYRQGQLENATNRTNNQIQRTQDAENGTPALASQGAKDYTKFMGSAAADQDEAVRLNDTQSILSNAAAAGMTGPSLVAQGQRALGKLYGSDNYAQLQTLAKGNTAEFAQGLNRMGIQIRGPEIAAFQSAFANLDTDPRAAQTILAMQQYSLQRNQTIRQQISNDEQNGDMGWRGGNFSRRMSDAVTAYGQHTQSPTYDSVNGRGPGAIAQQQAAGQSPGKDAQTGGTKGASFSLRPGVSLTMN